ncbi:MAG: hypothetical protein AABY15_02910 [Nanoarchaeota archaeon]
MTITISLVWLPLIIVVVFWIIAVLVGSSSRFDDGAGFVMAIIAGLLMYAAIVFYIIYAIYWIFTNVQFIFT